MSQYLLPCFAITLNIGSAVVYATSGDVRHMIYWIAAAVITATVTF